MSVHTLQIQLGGLNGRGDQEPEGHRCQGPVLNRFHRVRRSEGRTGRVERRPMRENDNGSRSRRCAQALVPMAAEREGAPAWPSRFIAARDSAAAAGRTVKSDGHTYPRSRLCRRNSIAACLPVLRPEYRNGVTFLTTKGSGSARVPKRTTRCFFRPETRPGDWRHCRNTALV